ncbi:MAG: NAD(P)H-dependent oxidoreductase [Oscillospiraceae bacterium]|nr:NAD(P)H-dependent oxidoreductase [Oscillospiraceae bacterium]
MKVTAFHGSPRKGNTYRATQMFMDELAKCGETSFTEFFMPQDLPGFCTGCTLCLAGSLEKCPNADHVTPILEAILNADALLFATPHYGACSMPAAMKNLFDHLDFLVFPVSPRAEIFDKKAFIITTGSGSTAALKPIKKTLKHWGVNRVYTRGIRMFTNLWNKMPEKKQAKYERSLRKSAKRFFRAQKKRPYLSTILFYHMSKLILRKYVGPGNYPYEYWKEKGYFKKRPF